MSNFNKYVLAKQRVYLTEIEVNKNFTLDSVELDKIIKNETFRAAKAYENAAFSGVSDDGGAGRRIHALKMFIAGIEFAKNGKIPEQYE